MLFKEENIKIIEDELMKILSKKENDKFLKENLKKIKKYRRKK